MMKPLILRASLLCGVAAQAVTPEAVLEHYADVAHATYGDALQTATTLQ